MHDLARLKDEIAVIGVGNTRYGNFPDIDEYGLAAQAFRNAVADCGIDKDRIDGLLVCRIPYYARMGEVLGLNPRWSLTLPAAWPHVRHGDHRGGHGHRRRARARTSRCYTRISAVRVG